MSRSRGAGTPSRTRVRAGNLRLSVGEGLLGALGTHDGERADDKLLKTCDLRKVLAPHLLVGEHIVHQLGIVGAGMGGVEVEHEGVVLSGVLGAVGATQVQAVALAGHELLRVEGDERSEARRQALGQVAGLGNVVLERGQVASAPLSRGVEADGEQRMINKRVVEAVFDGGGKGLAVLDIQVGGKRRNDLVVASRSWWS